jgi:hypothetical protein
VVSLKPSRYVGCTVDMAANMYQIQAMDGYVTYDCQLDPNGNHDWTVFADDYADLPPQISRNTYVEITGRIRQASEAVNSLGGAFQGYVPELKVQSITPITATHAHELGMALS